MSNLIQLQLEDGTEIYFSTTEQSDGVRGDVIKKLEKPVGELYDLIKKFGKSLLDSIREFNNPSEIELEFGVELSTKVGVIFANVDGGAHIKVKLKWQNDAKENQL